MVIYSSNGWVENQRTTVPALDLRPGQTLGRYELLLPIARGGMAQVWAARLRGSRGFQKVVAMKTILAGSMDDTNLEHMFMEEASLASQVHHPNVVEILDLGEHDGTLYLVMEWVDGEPLQLVLRQASEGNPMPLPVAVNVIGQACKGLHEAHELRGPDGNLIGLVHRDVSPQNILLSYSGVVKIADFGIAKATSRNSGLTEQGLVKGKSAFMSPEQMRSMSVDRRADVFAMGIVLYLVTTGKHPFRGKDAMETMQNVCQRPPIPPSSLVRDYPAKLAPIVMRALAKEPGKRWPTAHEMLAALEDAVPGCLEASFERDVANYLGGLFGDRAAQRRAALSEAQDRADRMPDLGTGSTQHAWLRDGGGTSRTGRATLGSEAFDAIVGAAGKRKQLVAIVAASAALLMGVLAFAFWPSKPEPNGVNSGAPAAAVEPTRAAPPEPPSEAPAEPPGTESSALVPSGDPAGSTEKPAKREARRPERAPARPAPNPSPAAAAPPSAPASAAPRPSAPAPANTSSSAAKKPDSSAWDPSTFGGRR
jgi:tRNA A-37 threonylcarbamoyl transferase component Bud32